MTDILANPVDICFGSMPVTSTAPAACLVIEGNAVTTNQQIGADRGDRELFVQRDGSSLRRSSSATT
jgi:hypothetical protein